VPTAILQHAPAGVAAAAAAAAATAAAATAGAAIIWIIERASPQKVTWTSCWCDKPKMLSIDKICFSAQLNECGIMRWSKP